MGVGVMFPGQGSQAAGMGEPWRDHDAWQVVDQAEKVLDRPLAHLLLDDDPEVHAATADAQLAVLLVSLVAWDAVRSALPAPRAVAGHSLGQVTALVASGALAFDDGVQLAAHRAAVTQRAAEAHPGKMAALVGGGIEQAEAACAASAGGCWVANDNAPGQVVVAGTPDGVDATVTEAGAIGVRKAIALAVAGAFHTPLMSQAASDLRAFLEEVDFAPGDAPVVSNGDARPHAGGDHWRAALADHLVERVRWRESQQTLVDMGVDVLVEVGPGRTLAGMAKRTVSGVAVVGVSTPADLEALDALA